MTDQTGLTEQLERCEGLMLQGQDEQAAELLAHLAEDAEEYVDKNCPTTDELQWFSFPTLFDRLAYRRVEKDPRELRSVGEPLDRLYNDLALANVHVGDYDAAAAALKGAIRWNPMDCGSRLNLADLYRVDGDMQEFLALSFSVFERASEARHLARAFVNFASWFEVSEKPQTAAAALRAGNEGQAAELLERQRSFFRAHVASWVRDFLAQARLMVETRFYRGVLALTEAFVAEEERSFEEAASAAA